MDGIEERVLNDFESSQADGRSAKDVPSESEGSDNEASDVVHRDSATTSKSDPKLLASSNSNRDKDEIAKDWVIVKGPPGSGFFDLNVRPSM